MQRPFRRLILVLAALSFESAVWEAREPCLMADGHEMAPAGSDCAHEETTPETPADHGQVPLPRHGTPGCAVAAACATLAVPVGEAPGRAVVPRASAVSSAVLMLAPGARPAPDVPPPRA